MKCWCCRKPLDKDDDIETGQMQLYTGDWKLVHNHCAAQVVLRRRWLRWTMVPEFVPEKWPPE